MKSRIKLIYILAVATLTTQSCDKYLDVLPDNRAEVNTETKIKKLLVSAYPQSTDAFLAEHSSDNLDDYSVSNPNSSRLQEQAFYWKDITEVGVDSPKEFWESCYKSIASANEALQAIEDMGTPSTLLSAKGEALVARAYGHFLLVNIFGQHYSKQHASTDLGIPYMLKPEKVLNPKYVRNTVEEVYTNIVKDLKEGIPLIDDGLYGSAPKFHMNSAAANAFAARVALYMQDWQGAVQYANAAIGLNPSGLMRDNVGLVNSGAVEVTPLAIFYNSSDMKANLYIQTTYSNMGLIFGNFYVGSRFSHGRYIADTETVFGTGPMGKRGSGNYVPSVKVYSGTNLDKILLPHYSYMFEMTDPVAQTGYRRGVYAPFTTEETMLVRAEANIHLKKYTEALQDMKSWVNNSITPIPTNFTTASINTWAEELEYYKPKNPTPKKKLNPEFTIEAGLQESMIHALLFIRRIETIHMGLRWYDVKRYGIEIERRVMASGNVGSVDSENKLTVRNKRAAIQLPMDVISAGLTPNPR